MATSRASNQPAGGNVALKTDANQRTEGEDKEELGEGKIFVCLLIIILALQNLQKFMSLFLIQQKVYTDNWEGWTEAN